MSPQPAPLAINVTLAALDPATVEIEAEIVASLNDMFLTIGEVGRRRLSVAAL